MKRLILSCVLLVLAPLTLAQRTDVLLTHDGTLYEAAVERPGEDFNTPSTSFIALTVGTPDAEPRRMLVPATLLGGSNSNPALAYDRASGSLFVFWQHMPNAMASELRFAILDADGNWSEPAAFQGANYHLRRNLRIAVTSKAYDKNEETGDLTLVPEVNVHAVWWESTGDGEGARYAMLTVKNNEVTVQPYDLSSLLSDREPAAEIDPKANQEIYRHPAIYESAKGDSVDLLFGDVKTQSFRRVTMTPIANARVRVPVGIADKGFDGPAMFLSATTGNSIETISPSDDTALFYFERQGTVSYVLHNADGWSPVQSLPAGLSRETAIHALRRLAGAH